MSHQQGFTFDRGRERINGALHLPDRPGKRPVVVICHGFKGFMDWGFFPFLSQALAERGFVAVRFNFNSSGMQPGDELVTDLEAFKNTTPSRDLASLRALLGALGSDVEPERIDSDRIGLLGHSRGGGISLLACADPASPVRALVTWSAVSTFERLTPEERAVWRQAGEIPVVNARTGQELALGRTILDDLEQNARELDLLSASARRKAPWLLVHGSEDETVPLAEGKALHKAAARPAELLPVPGASHTFGSKHPLAGSNPHLSAALDATQSWFRSHLT
jgi:dienelactone hydrolase